MCPNLICISIMMSFLKYITGFFYELWTFDRLRGHKTFFFAGLFWKGVKISHIWKLYRIFHSIFLRNQPTRNKNRLWQPCLLTDPDEISNLYRGPSIDASYQVLGVTQAEPTEPLVNFYSESTRPNDLLLCIGGAQQIFLILCQLTYGCNRQSCF
jgi:hypothetical protein